MQNPRKYRTVANMQSKSKVYIFRPFTDLGTPPPPKGLENRYFTGNVAE